MADGATQTVKNPKVFCSHRQCDKPRVEAVARKLREAGIDAWLDKWEILPGDDFVTKINEGLASYDVGLIFFSNEVEHGKWVQGEISAMTVKAIEKGKAVIPVMLDPDVPIPELFLPRARLGNDQLDELIDAIYGRTGKPPLGPTRTTAAQRSFVIKLGKREPGEVGVSAALDGQPIVAEQPVPVSADLAFSYAEFLRSRLPGARLSAETVSAARESELQKLGNAVGQLLFPEAVESAFVEVAESARKNSAQVELIVETDAPELLAIPFEAARLKSGRVPALESGVRMARRLAGVDANAGPRPDPQPGPLKVLVAVGAPDEGKTANTVLDMERELQSILDAIEEARKYGNAYVRILDVGSPEEIRSALAEQHYHVLHLSGHGNAGVLELEDEDGNAVQTTAKDIAEAIRDSGRPAPLVFLASCLSGAGDSDTASLAQGLLQQGMPAVLAMQTSVTDHYSTELAKAFYTSLSKGERPLVSQALALARQEVERERQKELAQGKHFPAEYATPSLFFAGEEQPLLDRGVPQVAPIQQTRKPASGAVPMLSIGDLIGRRAELRRVIRVLTDDERSVNEVGQKAGVQILGIGGVGKSAIAGRAMSRLADEGWTCVAVTGNWTVGEIVSSLSAELILAEDVGLQRIGQALAQPSSDDVRLKLVGKLLANYPVLLVLDNFEDNLKLGGDEYLDAATAQVMQWLYQSAQRGKLLITCRYPVPEAEDWLATEEPGPLSPAQTGKLMLRLGALSEQDPESLRLVQRTIGGHPRMLQYLDAILKKGKGVRVADVARRLREPGQETRT